MKKWRRSHARYKTCAELLGMVEEESTLPIESSGGFGSKEILKERKVSKLSTSTSTLNLPRFEGMAKTSPIIAPKRHTAQKSWGPKDTLRA